MKLVWIIIGVPLGFALTILSVPWVVVAMGAGTAGYGDVADRIVERCPLWLWLDWVER